MSLGTEMEYKICESASLGGALSREKPRIGIVLLAAGQSRRMGVNKQLLPWRGKTILDAVCHALQVGWEQSNSSWNLENYPMVAVTDGDHDIDRIASSYGFSIAHNSSSALGQGTSIALGVQYLMNTFGTYPLDGIICSVSDQPLLDSMVIEKLIASFQQHRDETNRSIVVPKYGPTQHPGNPVLFGAHWFEALQQIEGDQGGRTIIRGAGHNFVEYESIIPEWGFDIDTPEDYNDLQHRESEGV